MSVSKHTDVPPATESFQNLVPLILRFFWMLAGNFALLLTCLYILNEGVRFLSWLDIFYGATLVLVLAARYVEIKVYQGRTADGEAATLSDWARYALILTAVAAAGWLLVHGINFLHAR